MRAEEIRDEAGLRRWLGARPAATARADAVAIAFRAAARVMPLWAGAMDEEWARRRTATALPIMRSLLATSFLGLSGHAGKRAMAAAGASAKAATAATSHNIFSLTAARAAAVARTVEATIAAAYASTRADAADEAARAAADVDFAVITFSLAIADAAAIEAGTDAVTLPLWPDTPPDWFTEADTKAREIWAREPEVWEFWVRWWDGVLKGRPLPSDLLRDVALIRNEVWDAGPAAVADAIREIEERRRARDLDAAIAATDNAEDVVPNPETGLLRLVPTSALSADIGTYARRKIAGAVALFDDTSSQHYGALDPDLAMLRRAVEDAGNMPMELLDACASATRRLAVRERMGECPAVHQDALLTDYLWRLREVGADILAHDPQTQAVLERRNAITGNDALVAEAETVRAATALVVVITEGRLTHALPEDAKVATDPAADPEERKAASYRWAGRMLRIAKWTGAVIGGASGAVIGFNEVLKAVAEIQASPHFQVLINAILRLLGFS